jgi:hypothetical protein
VHERDPDARPLVGMRAPGETPVTADKELAMCRWTAWLGQPVLIEELRFTTWHGT